MLHLKNPIFMSLIFLIPLLIFFEKKHKKSFVFYSSLNLLRSPDKKTSSSFLWIPFFLRLGALCFLIIAFSRPQFTRSFSEVTSSGVDILLTLDTSRSMQALDFKIGGEEVDRLTVVKKVVADFINHRHSDRMGMIVFGEMAYTQCPLTLDYDVLKNFLNNLEVGIAGDGTAIGDALALSVKRLKDLPSESKIIILVTDGKNTAGRIPPEKAAELAATFHIKIYTIGVGTQGLAPILVRGAFGGARRVMIEADLDEESLQAIAEKTGGKFFRATDIEALEKIYDTIDKMEKSEAKVKHYEEARDLYPYFILGAFLFLFLEFFLKETLFRKFP